MILRHRVATVLLTVWVVAAASIYFRQFATPALRFLSRSKGLH